MSASRHVTSHPTEKPEKLLQRILLIGSKEGDTAVDPFMGSGTTGVAAKQLDRNFVGIEIDPNYFEMAVQRIEKTRKEPSLFVEIQSKTKIQDSQFSFL